MLLCSIAEALPMNPLKPDHLSTEERIAEVGRLLGLGVVRLLRRESSALSAPGGDSCLDFPHERSGHADTLTGREA
jgi:hypothetical protein